MNFDSKSLNLFSLLTPIIIMVLLLVYPLLTNFNYYFNILYLILIPGIPLIVKSIFQFFQGKPMYIAFARSDNVFYRYFYLSISIVLFFLGTWIFIKLFI